jgi:hypothetical protein
MKKFIFFITILCTIAISIPVFAQEVTFRATVGQVDVLHDKDGQEYIRVVVIEARILEGIECMAEIPILAFEPHVQGIKILKIGDRFEGICSFRVLGDRVSYTFLKFLP